MTPAVVSCTSYRLQTYPRLTGSLPWDVPLFQMEKMGNAPIYQLAIAWGVGIPCQPLAVRDRRGTDWKCRSCRFWDQCHSSRSHSELQHGLWL